ncbi:mechanosensitive ion channel domain-containing protein [Paraconexibacter sp.]|uniref:mechanosensitive ion channel domain-containing protein n=1 Tax=Paraconexibacter sp. TaxID=2949640 RepID=UPI00356242BB
MREQARQSARRARNEALLLGPIVAGTLLAYDRRVEWFGMDQPIQIVTVVLLVMLGWRLARDIGRGFGPRLLERLDPGTAGTVEFLIRFIAVGVAIWGALRIAGIPPRTLAVGGAFTAVVVGLAAQQTLGNLFAGAVMLSAQPFRVGDRVRLQGGGLAGTIEGTVSSLGLLYTSLVRGADRMMIPNAVVLACAVIPLREPAAVNLLARLKPNVNPSHVQALLDQSVTVETRDAPHISLEEIDDEEVVVRVTATPRESSDGARLADEVLAALRSVTRGEITSEHSILVGRPESPGSDPDD